MMQANDPTHKFSLSKTNGSMDPGLHGTGVTPVMYIGRRKREQLKPILVIPGPCLQWGSSYVKGESPRLNKEDYFDPNRKWTLSHGSHETEEKTIFMRRQELGI
ncbi:MAG: hypothetical protein M9908_09090 [Phyllobacteriaceae bacterium]|nr:hypothetical protein [Phyllobacteriaceae bacterium]